MNKPVLILLSLAVVSVSQAAVLTVTNTEDDGSPGCLRECIARAQPGDEIQFDPSLDGIPFLLSSVLHINKDLVIRGRGPEKTIISPRVRGDWLGGVRVLSSTVRVQDLTVSGEGRPIVCTQQGWLCVGSPIVVQYPAVVELDNCVVRDHYERANRNHPWHLLAGIYNSGELILRRSFVGDITLEGACDPMGACPWAGWSVGIYNMGILTVESCELSSNRATGEWWLGSHAAGVSNGGAHPWFPGTCTIVNSTISDNSARSVALYRPCDIASSTVVDRLDGWSGMGTIQNSIIWQCRESRPQSLGHNLDVDGSCGFDQPTDISGQDPVLGPLGRNYGPTRTRVPLAGSPVIDRGWCGPGTDQRGLPRPLDGNLDSVAICDIGAVEYLPYCDGPDRPCDDKDFEMVGPSGAVIVFPQAGE